MHDQLSLSRLLSLLLSPIQQRYSSYLAVETLHTDVDLTAHLVPTEQIHLTNTDFHEKYHMEAGLSSACYKQRVHSLLVNINSFRFHQSNLAQNFSCQCITRSNLQ